MNAPKATVADIDLPAVHGLADQEADTARIIEGAGDLVRLAMARVEAHEREIDRLVGEADDGLDGPAPCELILGRASTSELVQALVSLADEILERLPVSWLGDKGGLAVTDILAALDAVEEAWPDLPAQPERLPRTRAAAPREEERP